MRVVSVPMFVFNGCIHVYSMLSILPALEAVHGGVNTKLTLTVSAARKAGFVGDWTTDPTNTFSLVAKMAEVLQDTKITCDASLSSSRSDSDAPSPPPPPPDTPAAVWTRRIIIFCFWAVVASLGLPHWLWTTSIYRSELPVEQMTRWSEGHVSRVVVSS
jgi:hypothetical protein